MTVDSRKHNPGIIRVLFVNIEGSVGGAERSLLLLVRYAPKSIQISAACPAGVLADKLLKLGVTTYNISSAPMILNNLFIWLFYLVFVNLQLMLIVIKAKPWIIHANSSKAVLAAILPKVFTGSKLIWHVRDLNCSKPLAMFCGCVSSRVIAVSGAVKAKLVRVGVKAELIEVIYNGVAADNLSMEVKEKDQGSLITFANIGQFVPWKKQLLFIKAAERFLAEGDKADFILIGDDIFGRDGKYKKQLTAVP